jgi:endonuclease III-like uncharacterized protein
LAGKKWKYERIRELFERAMDGEQGPKFPVSSFEFPEKAPAFRRAKFNPPATSATARVYNEYHALLVRVGKQHCRKRQALCAGCPLEPFLPAGSRPAAARRGI